MLEYIGVGGGGGKGDGEGSGEVHPIQCAARGGEGSREGPGQGFLLRMILTVWGGGGGYFPCYLFIKQCYR